MGQVLKREHGGRRAAFAALRDDGHARRVTRVDRNCSPGARLRGRPAEGHRHGRRPRAHLHHGRPHRMVRQAERHGRGSRAPAARAPYGPPRRSWSRRHGARRRRHRRRHRRDESPRPAGGGTRRQRPRDRAPAHQRRTRRPVRNRRPARRHGHHESQRPSFRRLDEACECGSRRFRSHAVRDHRRRGRLLQRPPAQDRGLHEPGVRVR